MRQVMIVDAQGNQRYSSLKTPPPMHNVSDRTYFIAQQDGTATGMFMREPLVTRTGPKRCPFDYCAGVAERIFSLSPESQSSIHAKTTNCRPTLSTKNNQAERRR